jgi:hypothetical protein
LIRSIKTRLAAAVVHAGFRFHGRTIRRSRTRATAPEVGLAARTHRTQRRSRIA